LTAGRWLASLLLGFVFTSGLNWFVAEKLLNPMIRPGLGALMRTGGDTRVAVLTGGFALIVAVLAVLVAIVRVPGGWLARGVAVGGLLSAAAFFGTYTFLSGWTVLPTAEMCRTALADTATVIAGAVLISFVQGYGRPSGAGAGG
jgi:hypothetical protein